jgi:hypothetical protein
MKGDAKFLYVADSKLCNGDAIKYIDKKGGRLVCVIPDLLTYPV